MPIQIGESIPAVTLYELQQGQPQPVTTESLFSNRRIVLFALPGAFTPTCSAAHVPGFVVAADELKQQGIDDILCLSVNDAWVMHAWGEQQNANALRMLADGSADFTEAVDLSLDLTEKGMGVRSQRYAMVVDDGVVQWLGIDAPGQFEHSSAESVLSFLANA